MFRTPRYLEKTEYIRFNLDTPLTFPGNGQHQRKTGLKFSGETRAMSTTGTTPIYALISNFRPSQTVLLLLVTHGQICW